MTLKLKLKLRVKSNIKLFIIHLFLFFLVFPGDYYWIPFNISVPLSSTVPIELAVLSEMVDKSGPNEDGK